jgi:hypothetical protein
MATTLNTLVSQLPTRLQRRYLGDNGETFITWANDALTELEQEGHLPEINREAGVTVENDIWITPPSDYRRGLEIYNPEEPEIKYPFIETVGDTSDLKLKLDERMTFGEEETPQAISAFSAQATDSISINVSGLSEDAYKDWLLKITAGTIAPRSYRIASNDASAGGVTKLYFLHSLSTALTAAQATAGQMVNKDYYLVLRYISLFTPISAITDNVPVADRFVKAVKAFIFWKAFEWTRVLTNEAQYWQEQWKFELNTIGKEKKRVGRNKESRGRRMPGLEQNIQNRYTYTHDSVS